MSRLTRINRNPNQDPNIGTKKHSNNGNPSAGFNRTSVRTAQQQPAKSRFSPLFHPVEPQSDLHPQLVKQARKSGVLNLTNRGFVSVPAQVWNISCLTEKEVKTLSVSMDETDDRWWDQVELTRLNLANNLIDSIPNEIDHLNSLQILDLHDNKLSNLPEALKELKFLTKLDISHNQFTKIPFSVFELKDLRLLLVKNNQIEEFEGDIGKLNQLEEINLSNNQLNSMPPEMGFLSKLTRLDLSQNKIKEIPPEIGFLTALRVLDLSNNFLTSLPNDAGELLRLEQLYLRHNQLNKLPILHKCNSLKELYCGSNIISELSVECLEPLLNLKVLELRDNKLNSIPDDIVLLQFLERFDLTNNHLTGLPYILGLMPHLITLSLEGNSLKSIRRDIVQRGTTFLLRHLRSRLEEDKPEGLCLKRSPNRPCSGDGLQSFQEAINIDPYTMRQTRTLDLTNKQILEVPSDLIHLAGQHEVNIVNFSKNLLTEVPASLESTFPHLSELNLGFNLLTWLPPFLGNAKRLTYLDVRSNQLEKLPTEFAELRNLREICLANNRFPEIPSSIYALPKMEILIANDNKIQNLDVQNLSRLSLLAVMDLRNNDISFVPPELGNLRQLRSLQLEGNPFRQPRPAVLNKGTETLMQYLRDRIPT